MTAMQKNIAGAVTALALAIAGNLMGCRTAHLGPDTGRAYRAAFAAQTESGEKNQGPTLSADDADHVLDVHAHGAKGAKGAQSSTASAGGLPTPSLGGGGSDSASGGAWQGASGNISLDAK